MEINLKIQYYNSHWTKKSCTASTSRCPIQSLGKFPEALCGTTRGTCSARFFCPVMVRQVDCKQSLPSSKTVAKTQNKRGRVTVTVTTLPRAVSSSYVLRRPSHVRFSAPPLLRHAHSHARTLTCFAHLLTDFRGKERLLAVYPIGCSIPTFTSPPPSFWQCSIAKL